MGQVAFVFPGQNSHHVGMGKDLWESEPQARRVLEQADEVLGFSLTRLMFDGPEDQLTATENQQPAIVAHSAACLALLQDKGLQPQIVAGHSLGEYSALMAAGVLAFEEVLPLVRKRGELMAKAGGGAMAAVLGLELAEVEKVCRRAREVGIVGIANHNSPGQVVISGEPSAVRAATQFAKEAGARRVVPLRVSGAFHSPLMKQAAGELRGLLENLPFKDARVPLVSNVDGRPRTDAASIREALARQIVSPVLWEQSVRAIVQQGITTFVEVGPGKVIAGLIRRTAVEAKTYAAGRAEEIRALTL